MGKNHADHAELYSITPFKENDHWYLKLIYKYENKQGKHTVVIPLYEATCVLASERGAEEPACYFDIITEYASREMTLDEIEKELGYKVKIINKEKSDGNGKKM